MRFLISLLLLFILPGSVRCFWEGLELLFADSRLCYALLSGIGIGFILYRVAIRKWEWFLVFEHEFTHAVVALLFFRRIKRFVVTSSEGGYVRHSSGFGGEFGDLMIRMAPYYLPTFTIIAILLRPFLPQTYFPYYDVFIGFTFIYHILSTIAETIRNWHSNYFPLAGNGTKTLSDIAQTGFVLATLFIITLTLNIYGLSFWLIKFDYTGFIPFFKKIFSVSVEFYSTLINWIIPFMQKIIPNDGNQIQVLIIG